MALRIAGLPVPGPSDLLSTAFAVAGWTGTAAEVLASLPSRAATLLDDVGGLLVRIDRIAARVEDLLDRVDGVAARADTLVERVDTVVDEATGIVAYVQEVAGDAAGLVGRVSPVVDQAGGLVERVGGVAVDASGVVKTANDVAGRAARVVDEAAGASTNASELLTLYTPLATRAAPLAQRFVEELSESEVQAAIRLVDHLPVLTESLETDILPILATLDRVGPDVHELLNVLREVRQAINGIPGFGLLRRRGERDDG